MNPLTESFIKLVKESLPHEWKRYHWSTNYQPATSTKLELLHVPTSVIFIFTFKGLEFDLDHFVELAYSIKADGSTTKRPTIYPVNDGIDELLIAFESLLEESEKLTPEQNEIMARITQYLGKEQ